MVMVVEKLHTLLIIQGGFFNWPTKRGPDWLLGNFLFGTEIGEGQLKSHPVSYYYLIIYFIISLYLHCLNMFDSVAFHCRHGLFYYNFIIIFI